MNYQEFIKAKSRPRHQFNGIRGASIHNDLYDFQKHIVRIALEKERYCVFADCGLGKTLMQVEWARHVSDQHGPVLIFAPLAVSEQTVREGSKIGVEVFHSKNGDIKDGVNITNYEKIHKFSPDGLSGVVLDESSILKSYCGKTKQAILDFCSGIRFRLACTATPAPNDYEEIGNHSEFVGQMRRVEMLSTFFSHDGGDTSKWSLKGHGRNPFFAWMSQWSIAMRSPADIGYEDNRFMLPELRIHEHIVESPPDEGRLFHVVASTLNERRYARKRSISQRVDMAASLDLPSCQFLAWCNLNAEGEMLADRLGGAVEIAGRHSEAHKEYAMMGFSSGEIRSIVTKPSIAGHGMNWQNCNRMAFVGLSDSYEEMYQAIRRCWRYGQKNPVDVHIIISEAEGSILQNLRRKEAQSSEMFDSLIRFMGAEYNGYSAYSPSQSMIFPAFLERRENAHC
jgi:hypothetical protein